jgi:alpha-D-xyloside xylohydrolase
MEKMPIFVKEGSILPMEEKLNYADEKVSTPLHIYIYDGKDASFLYYEDDGISYDYEKEMYNEIIMTWQEQARIFSMSEANKPLEHSLISRKCVLHLNHIKESFIYDGNKISIQL